MTTQDPTSVIAGLTISLLLAAALYVWAAIALAAVFGKSGRESWKAWVPFLNVFVLLELGGLSGWLVLVALFPGVGSLALWVITVIACHRVGRSFGLGPGMTVLAAVLLPAWASVVGFGSARWLGAAAGPVRGPARARSTAVPPAPEARPAPRPVSEAPPAPAAPAAPAAPVVAPPAPAAAASAVAAPVAPTMDPAAAEEPETAAPGPVRTSPEPVAATPASARRPQPWTGLDTDVDTAGEITAGVSGAPAPIAAVPGRAEEPAPIAAVPGRSQDPAPAPVPAAAVTHVPSMPARESAEPWAPASAAPTTAPSRVVPETFPEASAEVSAIAGAPVADVPRAARSSVSAQHVRPEIPDDDFDDTEIAQRRRARWSLALPSGERVELTADVVVVGRRPTPSSAFPGAQLVRVADGTVSKTHARLQRDGALWHIVDLGSTNGTVLIGSDGGETEIEPGSLHPVPARFLVGDAEVSLVTDEGGRGAD